VEGIRGSAHETWLFGHRDRIVREDHPQPEIARSSTGWNVRTPRIAWEGTFPDLELRSPSLVAKTHTPDIIWWARLGNALTYFSALGEVDWNGRRGVALVEHAWGAQIPIDLDRLAARPWHWDVLVPRGGKPLAGLGIAIGKTIRPIPVGGGFDPDGVLRRGRGLSTRDRVADRWSATLALENGVLRYEAQTTTPLAEMFAGSGFVGLSFEGEWKPRRGQARTISGTGFAEARFRVASLRT
jgi:hypothetical protein